ncbi:GNAT family N-acetyltransferase [Rhizobium sp. XQZ8]|uniref:GNAT family N-acetyltransferase n=1 Tax=Rhizobium populisoli TaxID=2859785 RepID=UPI001CA5CEE3|nr:GNAT family N-acetyltransferase [Rhizobium populisoli]MBW6426163.1 GNAT family N-acetyltransferase [Rhizobium populisoli]
MPPEKDAPVQSQFHIHDVVIRGSRPQDAEAITEVLNLPGVRHGTLRQPFQSVERTRKYIESASPSDILVCAEWHGKIIGSAGLHRKSGRQHHVASFGIGVHDEFAGKGVGTVLLSTLIDTADKWHDIRRIELDVFVDNTPAIRLYEKFGFVHEGTLRQNAYRNGEYVDAHFMARLR